MKRVLKTYAIAAAALLMALPCGAQSLPDTLAVPAEERVSVPEPVAVSPSQLLASADSLRRAYDFAAALEVYQKAVAAAPDSLFRVDAQERMLLAQNGLNMTEYCSDPVVVAKRRFSLSEFFLFYPLENRSWRSLPNPLDSLKDRSVSATYVPEGARTIYYSTHDQDGIRNIYVTHSLDTAWTAPELINEQITSTSNEIWPMLSPDGKSLYFASEGLYGMGGYDIYVSRWDRETHDWGIPVNLGFPYSSPYNDYLVINTEDGKYSLFASDRECPGTDSVYVYVLEYDPMPVRRAETSPERLRNLSRLSPSSDPTHMDNGSAVSEEMPENEDTRRYMAKMSQVRMLRDSIYADGKRMDTQRAVISKTEDQNEKNALIARVIEMEAGLPLLQDSLAKASKELQIIEMDFLTKGVVIDPDKVQTTVEKEVVGTSSGYAFSKNRMGGRLKMKVQRPKPVFDYSFKVLPVGRFAEDNTLPTGLVYQIRLFSSASHATVSQLRGLSPVFEQRSASLRYTYYAGLFKTYKECLQSLNQVKRAGFRSASIVAFNDGSPIATDRARAMEGTNRSLWQVKIWPVDGVSLSDAVMSVIRQHTEADIARVVENGSVVYIVAPFEAKADAESMVSSLKAVGLANVMASEIR